MRDSICASSEEIPHVFFLLSMWPHILTAVPPEVLHY